MKKLQLEEMEVVNGGCRPFWCKVAILAFFASAVATFGIGVVIGWGTGIAACNGC